MIVCHLELSPKMSSSIPTTAILSLLLLFKVVNCLPNDRIESGLGPLGMFFLTDVNTANNWILKPQKRCLPQTERTLWLLPHITSIHLLFWVDLNQIKTLTTSKIFPLIHQRVILSRTTTTLTGILKEMDFVLHPTQGKESAMMQRSVCLGEGLQWDPVHLHHLLWDLYLHQGHPLLLLQQDQRKDQSVVSVSFPIVS